MELQLGGTSCHIACAGPLDGRPLLLVHGAANDHAAWHDLLPRLAAAGLRVYAPDLPGHGRSAGPALAGIEMLADWLCGLAQALDLKNPAIAGHSMGSLVALESAARMPAAISRVLLLGASIPMPVSTQLLECALKAPDSACRMVTAWSHTPEFFLNGGGGHGVWGPGTTLAVMRRNAATLAGDLDNCNRYSNGLHAAERVTCPSLLIAGRRDRMTPSRALQPLQEALQDVRRVDIADCGHAMMVEKPAEVAAAMIAFLA